MKNFPYNSKCQMLTPFEKTYIVCFLQGEKHIHVSCGRYKRVNNNTDPTKETLKLTLQFPELPSQVDLTKTNIEINRRN